MDRVGVVRDSRNGPVVMAPFPVTTEYERPVERVIFWPERDANPAFHLYEALWMLAGRNDVASLARYAKQMLKYSDDGETLHGAYGNRWRNHFASDQLDVIVDTLSTVPNSRRCVLQMWDPNSDMHVEWANPEANPRDVPCNLTATFQIDTVGRLEMVVFCRSNDIIWGAYGANAVHFSFLQEYLACRIGVPMGAYYQISVNWHAYLKVLNTVESVSQSMDSANASLGDPYALGQVRSLPMAPEDNLQVFEELLALADNRYGTLDRRADRLSHWSEWTNMVDTVLYAHELWRTLEGEDRYAKPLLLLATLDPTIDWVRAMAEWIMRRRTRWMAKMLYEEVG
jgi:thymidylate synthase